MSNVAVKISRAKEDPRTPEWLLMEGNVKGGRFNWYEEANNVDWTGFDAGFVPLMLDVNAVYSEHPRTYVGVYC